MLLKTVLRTELLKYSTLLPKHKTIENAIELFTVGQQKAGWTRALASKYVNTFPMYVYI